MNIAQYLKRIGVNESTAPEENALRKIHEHHVFTIPFGNSDVYFGKKLSLSPAHLFDKIILHHRDGFCYELNYLFHELLTALGFKSTMVSSRIFTSEGFVGPEFDHLSLIVYLNNKKWLLDVGFGELFVQPLELKEDKIQFDGRNYFRIEKDKQLEYILSLSADGQIFEKKYSFTLAPRSIADFEEPCIDKQVNPNSYFVQNILCTRPTADGRITVFNNKLIERSGDHKTETIIQSKAHLKQILIGQFGMAF